MCERLIRRIACRHYDDCCLKRGENNERDKTDGAMPGTYRYFCSWATELGCDRGRVVRVLQLQASGTYRITTG